MLNETECETDIANYLGNPDYFVVGVLEPWKVGKRETDPWAVGQGVISLLSAAGALGLAFRKR